MKYVLMFMILATSMFAQQGVQTGVVVGDRAPDFRLINIDGQFISLDTYKNSKGLVVVFTCNHCPYSVKYEDRIIALAAETAKLGYPLVAINPNDPVKVPGDSYENMQVRAKEKGFTFPYIVDGTQEIAKAYGAKRTPHVFLLSNASNSWKVEYIGAIDDNANDAEKVESRFVLDAVRSLSSGSTPTVTQTKAIGCTIKWKE
ncbi:MAG: thioredoxin family protein [Ignavibacteria bacterium]|nr:thioredoxin family protein [Ignavibacteria bacterium]